ncbi:hypothetical protein C1645_817279 [Glomus cerebriforme]|uniref:Uncharacterized protein n=1 Tax=Glomus cerebriforme TaxID=658196 RepID=A0A397TEY9_9GLOM|nr:hypothetical protein C1645_817279 [Glomus cerebriforme]
MGELIIYINPQKAQDLDQLIAKQKPIIFIDFQKAYNLDRHLTLQKLYYYPKGLYQNVKGLWDAFVDCMIRYKDFIFLTSKSSEEVAEAFKSIYNNADNPLTWPYKFQCDEGRKFIGSGFGMNIMLEFEELRFILDTEAWLFLTIMLDIFLEGFLKINICSNDVIKLERMYFKPSVKYNHPIGTDKSQLPKGPQHPFVREQLMHIKKESMLLPRWILGDN